MRDIHKICGNIYKMAACGGHFVGVSMYLVYISHMSDIPPLWSYYLLLYSAHHTYFTCDGSVNV